MSPNKFRLAFINMLTKGDWPICWSSKTHSDMNLGIYNVLGTYIMSIRREHIW